MRFELGTHDAGNPPEITCAAIPKGAGLFNGAVSFTFVTPLVVRAELLSHVLTQSVARIALVLTQHLEAVLFRFAANAETIVDRIAHRMIGILHFHKQFVIIRGRKLMQLLQSHKELASQWAKAALIVRPCTVEILATIIPIRDHSPATAAWLLIAENKKWFDFRIQSDTHQAMLLFKAVAWRRRGSFASSSASYSSIQELWPKVDAEIERSMWTKMTVWRHCLFRGDSLPARGYANGLR